MRYLFIFIYLAVSILLLALNWELFTTILVFDMGFGEFNTMPFFILLVFGGLVLGIFAAVDGVKDLKHKVRITELEKKLITVEKDAEIAILKNVDTSGTIHETQENEDSVSEIEANKGNKLKKMFFRNTKTK